MVPGRTRGAGNTRENLPSVGGITNGAADLWMKSNLRVKRPDPWHRANALPKAAAVLELSGGDAEEEVTDVSLPGS